MLCQGNDCLPRQIVLVRLVLPLVTPLASSGSIAHAVSITDELKLASYRIVAYRTLWRNNFMKNMAILTVWITLTFDSSGLCYCHQAQLNLMNAIKSVSPAFNMSRLWLVRQVRLPCQHFSSLIGQMLNYWRRMLMIPVSDWRRMLMIPANDWSTFINFRQYFPVRSVSSWRSGRSLLWRRESNPTSDRAV